MNTNKQPPPGQDGRVAVYLRQLGIQAATIGSTIIVNDMLENHEGFLETLTLEELFDDPQSALTTSIVPLVVLFEGIGVPLGVPPR